MYRVLMSKVIQSFFQGEVKLLLQVRIRSFFQKYLEEESSLVDGIVGFHDAIRKCEYCDESTVDSWFSNLQGKQELVRKIR